MSAFMWGDPHPLAIDRKKRKNESDKRAARHYVDKLAEADDIYLGGGTSMTAGIALFDRELASIRQWQMWSVQAFVADQEDIFAAEMCRAYALTGVHLDDLRLHATEKTHWLEVCVGACRQLRDRCGEGAALANLGIAWKNLGEARKAIGYYDQALVIAKETGDRRGEGSSLNNLGIAWAAIGDSRKAIEFYDQALTIIRKTGDQRSEGSSLNNLGLAWAAIGDSRKAIEFYD